MGREPGLSRVVWPTSGFCPGWKLLVEKVCPGCLGCLGFFLFANRGWTTWAANLGIASVSSRQYVLEGERLSCLVSVFSDFFSEPGLEIGRKIEVEGGGFLGFGTGRGQRAERSERELDSDVRNPSISLLSSDAGTSTPDSGRRCANIDAHQFDTQSNSSINVAEYFTLSTQSGSLASGGRNKFGGL
jgi:hypothetical protein